MEDINFTPIPDSIPASGFNTSEFVSAGDKPLILTGTDDLNCLFGPSPTASPTASCSVGSQEDIFLNGIANDTIQIEEILNSNNTNYWDKFFCEFQDKQLPPLSSLDKSLPSHFLSIPSFSPVDLNCKQSTNEQDLEAIKLLSLLSHGSDAVKMCSNCGNTDTPSWRRDPDTKKLVCNACGLYKKLHGKNRVVQVTKEGTLKVRRDSARELVCENCRTVDTPLWRRGTFGMLCNACGLYFKTHGAHRYVQKE